MITNHIVQNAETIYRYVAIRLQIQVVELLLLTRLKSSDFYIAIGWLAREGSISFIIDEKNEIIISRSKT